VNTLVLFSQTSLSHSHSHFFQCASLEPGFEQKWDVFIVARFLPVFWGIPTILDNS